MPNRLAHESSPYLLQHGKNPVDWFPWGPEALDRAKRDQKPIFLSIGYSACHWCHVMAHESFEDSEIARLLNEHFVSVKVDREDRPDLDQLYMEAVQVLTGHGGWPLSVFLTPSLEPFYGGTYWPERSRGGMPGFDQVLAAVVEIWKNRRQEAVDQALRLRQLLADTSLGDGGRSDQLQERLLRNAEAALGRAYDPKYGGFGAAPKFPHPIELRLLLRRWRRTGRRELLSMVTQTLDHMAAGGVYDHLGGGFHRYSTDARWLVPHFEKMLYDNALLAGCYLEAWQVTGDPEYAHIVRETLDYVLRDMTGAQAGFYSTEDADSEGDEGKFYLWTTTELDRALGRKAAETLAYVYDVTREGNFEGKNILNRPKTISQCAQLLGSDPADLSTELAESRRKLLAARHQRLRPGRDDKVLVDWNALMIEAMAQAGAVLPEPAYLEAARRAADFLLDNLRTQDGHLLHSWRNGQARFRAYLGDYAGLVNALVTLYEATFEERWVDQAVRLADALVERFSDREFGGFFLTAADHERLIARKKDMLDSSVPSGGGLATLALLRLGKLCGRQEYLWRAEETLRASSRLMEHAPIGTGQLLLALDTFLGPTPEIVILGSQDRAATSEVLAELHRRFVPNKVVAFRDPISPRKERSPALTGIFQGKEPVPPGPTVFVCENFMCREPVSGRDAALETVAALASGS